MIAWTTERKVTGIGGGEGVLSFPYRKMAFVFLVCLMPEMEERKGRGEMERRKDVERKEGEKEGKKKEKHQ